MKLTAAIQEALLSILFYGGKEATAVAALVPAKLYDPFFAELAESGIAYVQEYGQPAGEHTLDLINTLAERNPKSAAFYNRIHESILQTKGEINYEYVLKSAGAFMRYQRLKRGLVQAIGSLEQETEAGLVEAERTLANSLKHTAELFEPGTFMADTANSLRFLDTRDSDTFLTGIPQLDHHGLGPARKRLHLFAAPPKAGKSWWLVHLARQALMEQKRVLYVSLELSEEEVSQRIVQALFAMTKRNEMVRVQRFDRDELGRFTALREEELPKRPAFEDDSVREFLTNKMRPLQQKPPLLVKQFPTGGLTVEGLAGYLDLLEARHKFIPDLLIVDYLMLMTVDSNNYRVSIGENGKKLRGIAVDRNIAVASAAQINREGTKSRWIGKEHAAEDYSLMMTTDVAITYNQTQAEHDLGLARLYVAAGRTDKDRFSVLVSQSYATGQFVLDSVGYVSDFWNAVEQKSGGGSSGDDDDDTTPQKKRYA